MVFSSNESGLCSSDEEEKYSDVLSEENMFLKPNALPKTAQLRLIHTSAVEVDGQPLSPMVESEKLTLSGARKQNSAYAAESKRSSSNSGDLKLKPQSSQEFNFDE